jgi:very-short-patch-repair endonuclease
VPIRRCVSVPRIAVHRRGSAEGVHVRSIPVTGVVRTLLDLATRLGAESLERTVNEAMNRDLVEPDALRAEVGRRRGQPGVAPLRLLLDRHAFQVTDTVLEQRMLAVARRAGLPLPLTQVRVNGYRVDFFWPELGIVVEADGLRFHRTPAQQAADRRRDQAHARAGLVPLRFTHWQICREPADVAATLAVVAARRR